MEKIVLNEDTSSPEFTYWTEKVMATLKEAGLVEILGESIVPSHRNMSVFMIAHPPVIEKIARIITRCMQIEQALANAEDLGMSKIVIEFEDENVIESPIIVKH